MGSLGWTVIQHAWCPYKKGKFRYRDGHIQRETMWRDIDHQWARAEELGQILRSQLSEGANSVDIMISGPEPPGLWVNFYWLSCPACGAVLVEPWETHPPTREVMRLWVEAAVAVLKRRRWGIFKMQNQEFSNWLWGGGRSKRLFYLSG